MHSKERGGVLINLVTFSFLGPMTYLSLLKKIILLFIDYHCYHNSIQN